MHDAEVREAADGEGGEAEARPTLTDEEVNRRFKEYQAQMKRLAYRAREARTTSEELFQAAGRLGERVDELKREARNYRKLAEEIEEQREALEP